jgi:ABC-type bacteriocin/lantibiotic exporter with double-glycine peptidase domain
MLKYYKKHAVLVIVAIIITIVTKLSVPVIAIIEQQLVDSIVAEDLKTFFYKLGIAGLTVLVTTSLFWIDAVMQKKFKTSFEESIRNDLYDGVMRKREVSFREKDTGEMLDYIKCYSSTISNNFARPVFTLFGMGALAIGLLAVMVHYNLLLAVVALLCAVISTVLPLMYNKRLSKDLMRMVTDEINVTKELKESLNGHETIAVFNAFHFFSNRFYHISNIYKKSQFKLEFTTSMLENTTDIIQRIIWFVSYLVAGYLAINKSISVGTLVMFVTLLAEFNNCVTIYAQVIPILASCEPLRIQIKEIVENYDSSETTIERMNFDNELSVYNLSFGYQDSEDILEHVSLKIRKGKKIAITGPSGSGKSTFIKLLCGYYNTYKGDILYDNVDIKCINPDSLHEKVSFITQNTYIFNDTIKNNICLGKECDERTLSYALKESGVEAFLDTIPNGLDGDCGENGNNLSGGQKQRIALARALVRNVEFLILDEGVSALDVKTANEIEQELLNKEGLTLLTITHRIKDGLLGKYDTIYRLENKNLVDQTELLKRAVV